MKDSQDQIRSDRSDRSDEIREPENTSKEKNVILGSKVTPESKTDPGQARMTKHKKPSLIELEISTKAFIISHFLILVVGLGFLFGLYYYFYHTDKLDVFKNMAPLTQRPQSFTLDVSSPEDETIQFNKNILISGSTQPNIVVIVSENGDNSGLQSNNRGDFSKTVTLTPGVNLIDVSAIDRNGNNKTVKLTVYYSEEKI